MNLTNQEIKIVKLICQQKTNKEIASIIHRSKRTVENHRTSISFKLDADNVVGVVLYALKNGIHAL